MTAAVAEPEGIVRRVFRDVLRSMTRKAQNSSGVMAALFLPPEVAAELAQPGGLPVDQLHLTLKVFAPDASQVKPEDLDELAAAISRAARDSHALTGHVSGVGRFNGDQAGGGQDVVYATLDVDDLVELYQRIGWIGCGDELAGEPDHDWQPHVTLAYGNGLELPTIPSLPVRFDRLTLAIGDVRREYLFAGEDTAEPVEDPAPLTGADALAYMAKALEAVGEGVAKAEGDAGFLGELELEAVGLAGDAVVIRAGGEAGRLYLAKADSSGAFTTADLASGGMLAPQQGPSRRRRPKAPASGAPAAQGDMPLRKYAVVTKAERQRYTLGVAYPARQVGKAADGQDVDAHAEYMTPAELEAAAWRFMAEGASPSGTMHKDGTGGAGQVVESYVYRGPTWKVEDQTVEAGDWLLGVVWDEPTFARIEAGELTGYSLQGLAAREPA